MRFLKLMAAALVALALNACAGAVPWNPQGHAGMTEVAVKWCGEGADRAACKFKVMDGKEKGQVSFEVEFTPDGTIMNYAATDEKAFEGQAIRADVEKAVAAEVTKAMPSIVDAVKAAIAGVGS
ncbi:MAG: hypothetical protein V3W41_22350 [Planctomycetota bacterium]